MKKQNSRKALCHPDRPLLAKGKCGACYHHNRYQHKPRNIRKALCHPDKPYFSKGKCRNCYDRDRYHNIPGIKKRIQESAKKYYQTPTGNAAIRKRSRIWALKRNYQITEQKFQVLSQTQNNLCAICSKSGTIEKNKHLSVDHNHDTKELRGLLCQNCNTGLGFFKDNPELLLKASYYLETHNIKKVDHVPLG